MLKSKELFLKRARRNRQAIRKKSDNKLRLSVFRSSKNIYAQLIDDELGNTLVAASSLDKELKAKIKSGNNKPAAEAVGKLVAERALKEGLNNVVFDRGGVSLPRTSKSSRRGCTRRRSQILKERLNGTSG